MERARATTERGGKASLFLFVNQLDPKKQQKLLSKALQKGSKTFMKQASETRIYFSVDKFHEFNKTKKRTWLLLLSVWKGQQNLFWRQKLFEDWSWKRIKRNLKKTFGTFHEKALNTLFLRHSKLFYDFGTFMLFDKLETFKAFS